MHSRSVPLALLAMAALACGSEAPETGGRAVTTLQGKGRWSVTAPGRDGLDYSQRETIARLESIGYAQGVRLATDESGVRFLDPERA